MTTFEFPSPHAAWGFAQQAREMGHAVRIPGRVNLFPSGTHLVVWLGALIGGVLFGLLGAYAETFQIGLPRLAPIFAAPYGAPTVLFAVAGGCLGALIGGLLRLRSAHRDNEEVRGFIVLVEGDREHLAKMASTWGGRISDHEPDSANESRPASETYVVQPEGEAHR